MSDVPHTSENGEFKTYLIILRCDIPSTAGATKPRKSDGDIHEGTARTASIASCISMNFASSCASLVMDWSVAPPAVEVDGWGGSSSWG